MIIKIFLLAGVLGFAVMAFRNSGGAGQMAVRRLTAACLAVLGLFGILMPQAVTWLANRVGVGRGTDLVLYVLVVAFLWVTIGANRRIGNLERRYVELARRLAIHDALQRTSTSAQENPVIDASSDRLT